MEGKFKDTVIGILVLGIVSSYIANYVWDKRHPSANLGAAHVEGSSIANRSSSSGVMSNTGVTGSNSQQPQDDPSTAHDPESVVKDSSAVNPIQEPASSPQAAKVTAESLCQEADEYRLHHDFHRAIPLYTESCDLGSAKACRELGILYDLAHGVTQDTNRAAMLYQRSCDGGDAAGCYDLGLDYQYGGGVQKNAGKAEYLYLKACAQNHSISCDKLAQNYEAGNGVAMSVDRAKLFFQKACRLGSTTACGRLRTNAKVR